jgi:hypothetical protein
LVDPDLAPRILDGVDNAKIEHRPVYCPRNDDAIDTVHVDAPIARGSLEQICVQLARVHAGLLFRLHPVSFCLCRDNLEKPDHHENGQKEREYQTRYPVEGISSFASPQLRAALPAAGYSWSIIPRYVLQRQICLCCEILRIFVPTMHSVRTELGTVLGLAEFC